MAAIPGMKAPTYSCEAVVNGKITKFSTDDVKGSYFVLVFYPGDFTFVCPTEFWELSEYMKEFEALHTVVCGISTDSVHAHLAWSETPRSKGGIAPLNFPLLSDHTMKISRAFGVLNPHEDSGCALRATFIIDKEGMIRHTVVSSPSVGRAVIETLRALKALQYCEMHGEVCPAAWKPGKAGMKATTEGVQEMWKTMEKGSGIA